MAFCLTKAPPAWWSTYVSIYDVCSNNSLWMQSLKRTLTTTNRLCNRRAVLAKLGPFKQTNSSRIRKLNPFINLKLVSGSFNCPASLNKLIKSRLLFFHIIITYIKRENFRKMLCTRPGMLRLLWETRVFHPWEFRQQLFSLPWPPARNC